MIYMSPKSQTIKGSKIATSEKEINFLTNRLELGQRRIGEISLLYRASQHNFSTEKFHEKCDFIPHTITLVQTEYGKKIGGYTPLCWDITSNESLKDDSRQSFVFSLTNNNSFTLKKDAYAISNSSVHGPIFGGSDICIENNANIQDSSLTNICCSYSSGVYQSGNQESITKFNGNIKGANNFKIKQWQVFVVKWESEAILDSKIAVNEDEITCLTVMLEESQQQYVKEFSLLYRASQNEFSTYRFHEKCDQIKNTLILVQTEFGKKIGGYSPSYWDIQHTYVQQDSSAFLFSLTNQDMFFHQFQPETKTYYNPVNGPHFGSQELVISNKANINFSCANIGKEFQNPDYQYENQESITKFSGAIKDKYFRIKQWQVFRVKWMKSRDWEMPMVLSYEEIENLKNMLEEQQNKPARLLKLLYRASENDFSARIFHKLCDSIEHTVTIISTDQGIKVGGYTPLCWNYKLFKSCFQEDLTGKSFIFSLTKNHKFTLSDPKKAIYTSQFAGPCFGTDIQLGKYRKDKLQIGHSYSHLDYNKEQQSQMKFRGDQKYKVKQWQVYEVVWE